MSLQQSLHFRRCHVCGSTHHRRGEAVDRCLSCGKVLAKFYYFDDSRAPIYSEREPLPENDPSATDRQELRMPTRGRLPASSGGADERITAGERLASQLTAGDPSAGERRALRGFTVVW